MSEKQIKKVKELLKELKIDVELEDSKEEETAEESSELEKEVLEEEEKIVEKVVQPKITELPRREVIVPQTPVQNFTTPRNNVPERQERIYSERPPTERGYSEKDVYISMRPREEIQQLNNTIMPARIQRLDRERGAFIEQDNLRKDYLDSPKQDKRKKIWAGEI